MRTVIIGGGKGSKAIMRLAEGGFLTERTLDIVCVVDVNPDAPGMVYARENEIMTILSMREALREIPDIELVIELTGNKIVMEKLNTILPSGAALIDHTFARIFWDLVNVQTELKDKLSEITALEQKLEKEHHFLQSMFNSLPDPVVVLDKNKNTVKINSSFAKFSNHSFEEAIGMHCAELLSKTELSEKCEETSFLLDDILQTGKAHTIVWKTAPPDESYWEITRTPIRDTEGNIEFIMGIWHRITEKVQLRREIEIAEQRFKSFIYSAQDWISIKDLKGRYLVVNPVTARAFHREVDDFIGKKPEEVLPPDLAKEINEHDRQVIESNRHLSYDEIIPIDGRDHHFQTIRFPLTDYKGELVGSCTIARDVTAEYELRNQLTQADKLAAVGKLAAGVAHEINNPLTGVLAFAEDMLEDFEVGSGHHDDLKVIIRETLRCRDIVKHLLDFARQEDPRLEEISPNKIVDRAMSLISRLPQFRNISIVQKLQEDIPNIQGDPSQLQQVILNFMLNASDAMDEKGEIIIETRLDKKRGNCLITVTDEGPGVPEDIVERVFEPFFSTKGTNGLGLAVSWGIIERHGGTIAVGNRSDKQGAMFQIIIPESSEE